MRQSLKSRKGQTMIEVLVAIAVSVVIISSIVLLSNANNRRAAINRQSTQASKLTQEGMEIVRFIRDSNQTNSLKNFGGICGTSNKFGDLYNCVGVNKTAALTTVSCTPGWCLDGNQTNETVALDTAIFLRSVTIDDNTEDCTAGGIFDGMEMKKVTVVVTWQSPIGSQSRAASNCFKKP